MIISDPLKLCYTLENTITVPHMKSTKMSVLLLWNAFVWKSNAIITPIYIYTHMGVYIYIYIRWDGSYSCNNNHQEDC